MKPTPIRFHGRKGTKAQGLEGLKKGDNEQNEDLPQLHV
jgi:hypothetical protein